MFEFKKFWISQSFSLIGNELTKFAIPVWLYQKYGTVSSVAIGFAIISCANIVMGPIAGVLVDNYSKRAVLLIAEMLQLLVIGLLLSLVVFGLDNLYLIYFLLGVSSLIDTVRFPAMMASVPLFVSKKELLKVNGIVSMTDSIANMGGPLLGGAIMAGINIKGVFLVDIGTFLLSILILLFIKFPRSGLELKKKVESEIDFLKSVLFFKENLKSTLSLIKSTKNAHLLLGTSFSMNFFIIGVFVIITPMFLFQEYSVKQVSYVMTAVGVTQIFSGYLVSRLKVQDTLSAIFVGILVMGVFGYMVVAFSGNGVITTVGICILFGSLPFINSCNRSTVQKIIPNDHHGRFFSTRRSISQSLTPVSAAVSGFILDLLPSKLFIGNKFQLIFLIYGFFVLGIGILGVTKTKLLKS
jgi:DHA3 family macrolide efflux protein-like MFS transporter